MDKTYLIRLASVKNKIQKGHTDYLNTSFPHYILVLLNLLLFVSTDFSRHRMCKIAARYRARNSSYTTQLCGFAVKKYAVSMHMSTRKGGKTRRVKKERTHCLASCDSTFYIIGLVLGSNSHCFGIGIGLIWRWQYLPLNQPRRLTSQGYKTII